MQAKTNIHPRNSTWPLKNDGWKMSFLLGLPILGAMLNFRGCSPWKNSWLEDYVPFGIACFQGRAVKLQDGHASGCWVVDLFPLLDVGTSRYRSMQFWWRKSEASWYVVVASFGEEFCPLTVCRGMMEYPCLHDSAGCWNLTWFHWVWGFFFWFFPAQISRWSGWSETTQCCLRLDIFIISTLYTTVDTHRFFIIFIISSQHLHHLHHIFIIFLLLFVLLLWLPLPPAVCLDRCFPSNLARCRNAWPRHTSCNTNSRGGTSAPSPYGALGR